MPASAAARCNQADIPWKPHPVEIAGELDRKAGSRYGSQPSPNAFENVRLTNRCGYFLIRLTRLFTGLQPVIGLIKESGNAQLKDAQQVCLAISLPVGLFGEQMKISFVAGVTALRMESTVPVEVRQQGNANRDSPQPPGHALRTWGRLGPG